MKLVIFCGVLSVVFAISLARKEKSYTFAHIKREDDSVLGLKMCDRVMCDCKAPNESPGDIVHMTNTTDGGCLCSCGREIGEMCDTTGQCAQGNECIAPTDFSEIQDKTKGICEDKCKMMTCPQFYHCKTEGPDTFCVCDPFSCSDRIKIPVTAILNNTGTEKVFANNCEMVNENCGLMEDSEHPNLWVIKY